MTTPNCTHCNDTGRLPGSDYFDCAHCDVAKERTELGEFAEKAGVYELAHVYDDALFAVHRRATAIGRASALAELHPNWLAEKERADRAEARIAELEAQIAAKAAPVVEQQPIGYTCQYDLDCLSNYNNVTIFPGFDKDISPIALYTAPKAADTDKLREAILEIHVILPSGYDEREVSAFKAGAKATSDAALKVLASTALQAPVREVPGWQPIETAPKDGSQIILTNGETVVQGWWEHQEPYIREQRDTEGAYIDQQEHDGFDGWLDCEGGMQPDPTHWMPLPAAPVLTEPKP